MSESPDALAQQIAALEAALKLPLPEESRRQLLASLQALQATAAITGDVVVGDKVGGDKVAGDKIVDPQGTVDVRDDARVTGVVVGVNTGTIQAFFGAQPPADAKALLDNYLESLLVDHAHLRLGKLLGKEQTGREQAVVPALALRAVYTALATNARLLVADFRLDREVLQQQLRAGDPAAVLPDQARLAIFDTPQERGIAAVPRAGAAAIAAGLLTDQWQTSWRAALEGRDRKAAIAGQWLRPELAVEALATHPRLVLLGNPGSGKSTVLRYLLVSLAEALLAGRNAGLDLRGWEHVTPLPTPLFCQLGRVAKALDDNPERDLEILIDVLLGPVAVGILRQGLPDTVLQAWRTGGTLLCLDGLDEVSGVPEPTRDGRRSRRERVADAIRQLGAQIGRTRMVVTCRVKPYQQSAAWQLADPWLVRTIEPFAFGQVRHFVPTWYAQTCAAGAAKYAPDQAQARAETLVTAITTKPGLHAITTSPLLLTMLVLLHYNQKQLPDERADVYEELVKLLLERWEGIRSTDKDRRVVGIGERLGLPHLRADHLRPVVHAIAFEAHRLSVDGRGVVPERLVRDQLDAFFAREIDPDDPGGVRRVEYVEKTDQFLDLLVNETGLIQPEGDATYVLPHLTFEEYLAACHLAGRGDLKLVYAQWCAAGDRWREPLLLLMGRLRQQEKFDTIFGWLQLLLAEKEPLDQRQRDLLLVAACYEDLGRRRLLARYVPEPAVVAFERQLRTLLVETLERPDPAVLLVQRIEVGDALGRLGDERVPVTLDAWRIELARRNEAFGSPAGYWCYVRKQTYTIGGWEEDQPAADIALPTFWIARFPITVVQFAPFVEVGYSPDAKHWWTPNGWKWKGDRTEPAAWNRPPYDGPNQPVIGVTWYEATVFCAWLTEQLGETLPAGYIVRLPTDAEWEAAAAYDEAMARRTYPWGEDEPTTEHAIYDASNLGRPAPVGCCPSGVAACGALDMAGNVWEMMASSYRGYPERGSEVIKEFTTDAGDVPWRGGSYYDNSTFVRCGARSWGGPDSDDDNLGGFRVVVAPRSH